MSRENAERVKEGIDAINRRDLDALLALADPDVEFTPYTVTVEGGYSGHDGIRRWWHDLFGVFPDWKVEVGEVRDLGDWTLTTLHVRGHGEESGTPVGQTLWQVAEWSGGGRLIRASHNGTEAEALEAVGLRE